MPGKLDCDECTRQAGSQHQNMEGCEELCTQLYTQICKQTFHRTRLFSVIHNTITDIILWTLDLMNFENEFNSYNNVKFKVNKSTFTFILFMLHVILTNGIRSNLKEIDIMTDDLFPTKPNYI